MPIAKINPDGTVKIYNSDTNEVKDVNPEELANYNPAMIAEYEKLVATNDPETQLKQQEAQAELNKIESHGGGLTSKQAGAKEVIDQLFNLYYGKPGEQSLSLVNPGEYRLPAQLKALETKFKAGEANSIEERIYKYNRILESKRAQLAKSAGDAGNLALQEQILAGKGLPGPDSTDNEALGLFDSAYGAFAGGKNPPKLDEMLMKQEQGQSPIQEQTTLPNIPQTSVTPPKKGGKGLAGLLLPRTTKTLDYIEQGIPSASQKGVGKFLPNPKFLGDTLGTAGELVSLALPLGKVIKGASLPLKLGAAGAIHGGTKPETSLGKRAKSAVKEGIVGAVAGTILSPTAPVKAFGKIARAGTKEVKIPTSPMLEAAKDYAKDIPVKSPLAKSIIEVLKKRSELTLPELEKKMGRWGKLAYTKSEEPRAKAESQLINAVYGAARQQIKEKAPLVSTARTLSDVQRKAFRGLGRILSPIPIGAGIAGATGGILAGKLFGRD